MMAALRQEVARSTVAVRAACRVALIKAGLVLTAGLAVLAGSGFLLAAVYGALSRTLGYASAGLILGTVLLAVAAALGFAARMIGSRRQSAAAIEAGLAIPPTAAPPTAAPPPAAPSAPVDLAPMAVFTAAFVLARRISQAP